MREGGGDFWPARPQESPDLLGQLGNRIQHALRASRRRRQGSRAAARTFPKTNFYDIEETLTTLGIGEERVSVLPKTVAIQPFATRIAPPASRMGKPSGRDALPRIGLVRHYATRSIGSAHESISRMDRAEREERGGVDTETPARRRAHDSPPGGDEADRPGPMRSVAVVRQSPRVTRGLLGGAAGKRPRRGVRWF